MADKTNHEIIVGVPHDALPPIGGLVPYEAQWFEVVEHLPRNQMRLKPAVMIDVVITSGKIVRNHPSNSLAGGWVSVARADQRDQGIKTIVVPVHDVKYMQWLDVAADHSSRIPVPENFFERNDEDRQQVFEQVVRMLMLAND